MYSIWIATLFLYCFCQTTRAQSIVCPAAGMVNNFNQNANTATKCFYVINVKSGTRSDPFNEGIKTCKEYGGPLAGLASPENPIENEMVRFVVEDDSDKTSGGSGLQSNVLLGIRIKQVMTINHPKYTIAFEYKGADVVDNYVGPWQIRYEQAVGQIGLYNDQPRFYSYFLQPDADPLSRYSLKQSNSMCVVMDWHKGEWIVQLCTDNLGERIACQSKDNGNCQVDDEDVERACPGAQCPNDCEVSDWIGDGPCSVTCDNGVQPFVRTITKPADAGGSCGPLRKEIPCEKEPCNCNDCTLDADYTEWSPCTVTCGQGMHRRKKKVLVNQLMCGACDNPLIIESCNAGACLELPSEYTDASEIGNIVTWYAVFGVVAGLLLLLLVILVVCVVSATCRGRKPGGIHLIANRGRARSRDESYVTGGDSSVATQSRQSAAPPPRRQVRHRK